jgi:hypothetical protein
MAKSVKAGGTKAATKAGGKAKAAKAAPRDAGAASEVGPIDTDLAARAAASMLLHRPKGAAASTGAGGSLRQIKQDLARPLQQPLGSMLHGSSGPGAKHPHLPMGGKGAAGHARGTGAAGNRIGLPRRMGGS